MKVGLYANLSKPDAAATLKALATSARDLGVTLITSSKATARLAANCRTVAPARLGKSVDILLSLGGDGTVLQAVHALNGAKVPVLGINLGNLGFLTSVPDTAAMDALQAIASRYNSTTTNSDPSKNHCTRSNPNIIFNNDTRIIFWSFLTFLNINHVST